MSSEKEAIFRQTDSVKTEILLPKRSKWNSIKYVLANVTIEPGLFLLMMGVCLHMTTAENLLVQKICLLDTDLGEDVCEHIQEQKYKNVIDDVQKKVSYWKIIINLSPAIPSVIACVFVGAWSDIYGRKPFMILPIIGETMGTLFYLILSHYLRLPIILMIVPSLMLSLFGGFGLFSCIVSYVTDVSSTKNRTMRLTILELSAFLGTAPGIMLGGLIFEKYGYFGVFICSAAIEFLALVYFALAIKESRRNLQTASLGKKIRDFFKLQSLIDSFKAFTVNRGSTIRMVKITVLLNSIIATFAFETSSIKYLFAQKMFSWGVEDYSIFSSITLVGANVMLVLVLGVLSGVMKLSDSVIAVICSMLAIVGYALTSNSTDSWLFYVSSVIASNSLTLKVCMRTIISKMITKDEIGKVFSFVTTCEQIAPVVGESAIPALYANTIDFYPGLVFMLIAFLLVFTLCTTLWYTTIAELNVKKDRIKSKIEESSHVDYDSIN